MIKSHNLFNVTVIRTLQMIINAFIFINESLTFKLYFIEIVVDYDEIMKRKKKKKEIFNLLISLWISYFHTLSLLYLTIT